MATLADNGSATDRPVQAHEVAVETFGVRLGVGTPHAELLPRIQALLPPGSRACDPATVDQHLTIYARDARTFDVRYDIRDGEVVQWADVAMRIATHVDLEFGLAMLENYLHGVVSYTAPDHLFIAGAALGLDGMAIVFPGHALTGRTTLVTALLRAGAVYYSDEYVVLDEDGLVHPYAVALPASSYGHTPGNGAGPRATADAEPIPIGALLITKYRPGAEWEPRRLSQGEAALALLSQSVPHQEHPERSMRMIARALQAKPPAIISDRDEAEVLAPGLLDEFRGLFASR